MAYSKYQLVYEDKIPDEFANLDSVRIVSNIGRVYVVLVRGSFEETRDLIQESAPLQCDELPVLLEDIFIINTVHKDPCEKEVNQLLAEKVEQYRQKRKKIYLIDWYSYAKNERKYFYKDRTHLNDAGQKFYADFITSEIKKHYSEK